MHNVSQLATISTDHYHTRKSILVILASLLKLGTLLHIFQNTLSFLQIFDIIRLLISDLKQEPSIDSEHVYRTIIILKQKLKLLLQIILTPRN